MTPKQINQCCKAPLGHHAALIYLRSGVVGCRRADWTEAELDELTKLVREGARLDQLTQHFKHRTRGTIATQASVVRKQL